MDVDTTASNIHEESDSDDSMRADSPHPDEQPIPASSPLSSPVAEPTSKPKSAAKSKAKEPSPEPPPRPEPRTIRLQITLGGPDNYAVDISQLAKDTGQRPPTPQTIAKADTSDSEPEKSADKSEKKRKKRKNAGHEYYDTNDPFIDDSELAIDERKFFAQTKQQGFYVSSGEVALLKDSSPKKPKSKKPPISLATPAIKLEQPAEGTRESPIALISDNEGDAPDTVGPKSVKAPPPSDDEDVKTGQKRKRYVTVVENGKKRKIVDITSFHPELQSSLNKLKEAIAKESWEAKGKFPPSIKPLLASVALHAVRLDEYDEHFFNLMPVLFPYNKFTMMKLIKRTIFPDHIALLNERSDTLLAELKKQADEGFSKAEEEWEKSVLAWDKRQEKARGETATNGGNTSTHGEDSSAPTRHGTEEIPGADGEESKEPTVKDTPAAHPPAKKFRMTESMKGIVWELVQISNECCRLENEKNSLEGSVLQVSEQGLRKLLYQKIVAAFPEGWMSSGQISRDVSAMKKKYEKEAMENE